MNKQPEITAHTRQNIIDAFWSIYCEKRIEQITVREVAEKAGYNRGTFYEYFSNVFDVLDQIEISLIPNETEMPPIAAMEGNMSIDVIIKLFEQNGKFYSVLLGENGDPAFAKRLKTSIKPIIRKLIAVKNPREQVEMDYILEYMLSSMIGILSYWFQNQKSLSAERLIELMYDMLENGVMKRLNF